jgi:Tol biopolymer transport system component
MQLVFVGVKTELRKNALFVFDLQMREFSKVIDAVQSINGSLSWPPNGDRIYYLSEGKILAVGADGSGENMVLDLDSSAASFFGSESLTLSADGTQIAFMRGEGTKSPLDIVKIWKVNTDGTGLEQLSP